MEGDADIANHTCLTVAFAERIVMHATNEALAVTRGALMLFIGFACTVASVIGTAFVRYSVLALGAMGGAVITLYTSEWRDQQCTASILMLVAMMLIGAGIASCLLRLSVRAAGFGFAAFFVATVFRAFPQLDALRPPVAVDLRFAGWNLVPFWASVLGAGLLGACAVQRLGDVTSGRLVALVGGGGAAIAFDEALYTFRGVALPGYGVVALGGTIASTGLLVQSMQSRQRLPRNQSQEV